MNLNSKKYYSKDGFTMLELVIIVSVILALGAAVIIWVDPVERIGSAKQAKRREDVNILSVAFSEYARAHQGALPILGEVTTEKKVICNNQTGLPLTCDTSTELCLKIDDPDFFTKNITNLPIDPDKSSDSDTGYYIKKDVNNNISIGACDHTFGYIYDKPQLRATCEAYGGGYCWYLSGSSSYNCDQVCALLDKTCVNNITYGPDKNSGGTPLCIMNRIFDGSDCGEYCMEMNGAYPGNPPAQDNGECLIQSLAISCSATTGAWYNNCPCQ